MFNLSGSELIFLLLLALVVLGPEKLPDAIRKFGRIYAEVRKMSTGFQNELRQAMDEPMRELRETAELTRRAATFDPDTPRPAPKGPTNEGKPASEAPTDTGIGDLTRRTSDMEPMAQAQPDALEDDTPGSDTTRDESTGDDPA